MKQAKSVLFACNRNSIRSPMAAAIVRQRFEGNIKVESCGLEIDELNPFAFGVCEEVGLNLIPHFAKTIEQVDVGNFDLVVALSQDAAGNLRSIMLDSSRDLSDMEFWAVSDPSVVEGSRQQIVAAFRACREELERLIKIRFAYAAPKY